MGSATFVEIILAILLPPVGVFFRFGIGIEFWICLLLTILGYLPGIIYAIYVLVQCPEGWIQARSSLPDRQPQSRTSQTLELRLLKLADPVPASRQSVSQDMRDVGDEEADAHPALGKMGLRARRTI
ncbi:hypothetical protein R1sor_011190 [Riccia sorocarpa]|uniref:Uncharacterized protein n=1 Tax=Riccia sorocarpa TaxID=122646 RepID=A0ABD3I676_9MARC